MPPALRDFGSPSTQNAARRYNSELPSIGVRAMAQDSATIEVDPRLVTRIVGKYVRHHKLSTEQLGGLIAEVHRTLGGLGRGAPPDEALVPAVPIRRSVRPDYVVCLDCGYRGKMLRRHIRQAHGLEPAAYRARWNLSADHPLTAPSYAEQRSTMAKEIGLGQRRRQGAIPPVAPTPAMPSPAAAPAEPFDPVFAASLSAPKRRGRKPRSTPAT
jgi:predicted transcriptional regulator